MVRLDEPVNFPPCSSFLFAFFLLLLQQKTSDKADTLELVGCFGLDWIWVRERMGVWE